MVDNKNSPYTHHVPPPCLEDVGQVYADDEVIVVNKPPGLLSVPGRFVKDCVLNRLLFEFGDVRVVHRLDLDTSGLLVFARSKVAVSDLSRQFRERLVNKEYQALVWGRLEAAGIAGVGEIDAPIAPDPINRPRQVIADHGKPALTRFEVLGEELGNTRLALFPVTGRSHQLRLHLAHVGHPILGCDLYASAEALAAAGRLCLHASRLAFDHPVTGEKLEFESTVPF